MTKKRVIFMGTPDFAVPCLEALAASDRFEVIMVVTQPDRPKGRGLVLVAPPVKEAAKRLGIERILQPEKLRRSPELEQIMSFDVDYIITVAYGQLLPQKVLDHAKVAPINVHASLLPAYRGSAPLHRVLIQGEKETGITTMRMVRAMDAGDILLQDKISIDANLTVGELHDKLSALGADTLLRTLLAYEMGSIHPIPQDTSKVSYADAILDADQEIDWHQSAVEIHNRIRGLNPWPVAYSLYQGQIWKLWKSQPLMQTSTQGVPGEILQTNSSGITVQCGSGCLLLSEIQPANKKKMSVEAYLRGNSLTIGTTFERKVRCTE